MCTVNINRVRIVPMKIFQHKNCHTKVIQHGDLRYIPTNAHWHVHAYEHTPTKERDCPGLSEYTSRSTGVNPII